MHPCCSNADSSASLALIASYYSPLNARLDALLSPESSGAASSMHMADCKVARRGQRSSGVGVVNINFF